MEELLNQKHKLLTEVLALSRSLKFCADREKNINSYIELYQKRKILFDDIIKIDNEIFNKTGEKKDIVNDEIKKIAQEIRAFDRNNRKNEEEFEIYLSDKMKGLSQKIKLNKAFNYIDTDQIIKFNIEG